MSTRTSLLAILLALLGVLFIAFAIFYATTDTGLLASDVGRHYKHAIVAAILGFLCFVGANFARRREI
jgi:drug/metabolite transporter (DMT)-like permease